MTASPVARLEPLPPKPRGDAGRLRVLGAAGLAKADTVRARPPGRLGALSVLLLQKATSPRFTTLTGLRPGPAQFGHSDPYAELWWNDLRLGSTVTFSACGPPSLFIRGVVRGGVRGVTFSA